MENLTRYTILILIGLCLSSPAQIPRSPALAGTEHITFAGSIRPVATSDLQPSSGSGAVVRSELSQSEGQASMEFSVALRMRDFGDLQERARKGEVISLDEIAARYYPRAADCQKIVNWLTSQGFAVQPPAK